MKVTVISAHPGTSFRLAAELHRRGALERLLSTRPPLRGEQIPPHLIRWNPWPEVLMRSGLPNGHYLKALTFGRWAARHVGYGDLTVCWSQFALETLRKCRALGIRTVLVRQSLHIEAQLAILRLPRTPLVERELREYELADYIETPTEAAKKSFTDRGFHQERILIVPPVGVDSELFHPNPTQAHLNRPHLNWPWPGLPGLTLTRPATNPTTPRILRTDSISTKEFHVLLVGCSFRKGTGYSLEACRLAQVPVWVVGRPDGRIERLEGLSSDPRGWGRYSGGRSEPLVTFLGPLPQWRLAQLYKAASVTVIGSLEEGLPHTLIESLASGTPVIATTNSGAGEVIQHGREGWLVLHRDVEMMAEYLVRLKASESLRTKMSAAAAETGKHWDWSAYGTRAFAAYQRILSGSTSGR